MRDGDIFHLWNAEDNMKHDIATLRNSQRLRRNMTKEERHLWYDHLRSYPVQFKRQVPIGSYIVDFYCHKAKLVLELDGSQHCLPEEAEYDRKRTAFLEREGICVMRISNLDVMRNFRGVCETVDRVVQARLRPD